jgi:uncharacterized peroxidase-related enzyme
MYCARALKERPVFLKTVSTEAATGEVAKIYAAEKDELGFVMEATEVWTTRPEIMLAWGRFSATVSEGLTISRRDWKLITLVCAKHIHSTYCSLVYGRSLADELGSAEAVIALETDFHTAGLSDRDVTMLEYAEQITLDASKVTDGHIAALRTQGFSDEQIFDIALCAGIRNFVSRLFDATGATPDPDLWQIQQPLRETLTVGRSLPDGV